MGLVGIILGLGLLAPGGFLASRHGFRQPAGWARWLGGIVLAWAWVTIGVELLGSVGLLGRVPLILWSASGLLLATIVRFTRPGPVDPVAPRLPSRAGLSATIAVGLVLWACLRMGLVSLLFPVKVVSDGPIYHLYFAARWWKAGRVFRVASPFGEVGATYFWANGEAWFAWLMTLRGGDTWAKLGQVPFFGGRGRDGLRDGPSGGGLGARVADRLGLLRLDHAAAALRVRAQCRRPVRGRLSAGLLLLPQVRARR